MPGRHFNQILIQTKLNRPAIGPNSVVRPRLISRLDDALKGRVTLISAPAGYGKTTLVLQWLDQRRIPAAWYAADNMDSDPDRFLSYVVTAVRIVVPEFGSDIVRLLSSPQLPPPEYLADVMLNALAAIDQPLLIVLDDYHRITSKAVNKILTGCCNTCRRNCTCSFSPARIPICPMDCGAREQWLARVARCRPAIYPGGNAGVL